MRRLYDRYFFLALISQTFFSIANTLLAHYARWVEYLGGDEVVIGGVSGVAAGVGLAARPFLAGLIDRHGPRATCLAGCLIFTASVAANLLIPPYWILVATLRAMTVMGGALFFASSLTYVALVSPPERRTEAIGVLRTGGFMGMLFGPGLGDVFVGGATRTHAHFAALFGTAAVAALLCYGLILFLKPTPVPDPQPIRLREFVRAVRAHWPGAVLLVNMTFGLCMTAPFTFLAPYLDKLHMRGMGMFFFGYAGWGLTVRLLTRSLPDRLGRGRVLVWGLCLFSVGMFSFLLVDPTHPWTLLAPALVCGTSHALLFHTMVAVTLEHFPPENRGAGSVLALMALDFGTIGGAPVLGVVAKISYAALFIVIGVACLTTAFVYGLQRSATAPASADFATAEPIVEVEA